MNHLDASEQKFGMWRAGNFRCFVCEKPLLFEEAQFAHRIPKHKKYLKKYGAAIIHHRKNGRITCAKCNSKVLLDPATHPIEAAELIEEIKEDLHG